jgi:ribonuclease J
MKSFKPFNIGKQNNNNQELKLIPLGGVGDVTKNMYVYEYGNDIIIVDCGVGFPDEAMPGVDLVIPDISYLRDKKAKIKGIIITHGHDDHIGGLPYLWPELQVPIYTQKLTAGFIKAKFTEHNLPKNKIFDLDFNAKLKLGIFDISFYLVSHSIPDSQGIVIKTPVGTIIHQADFKIDWTPVSGQVTDVGRVAQVGAEGVKLLLIDCLRVEKPGFNKSEKSIEATFEKASIETPGKLLITMTSSNVSRMQQAINVAQRTGRKVALAGRSFENNFQVARDLGYLDVPSGIIIASDAMSTFQGKKLLILIAGSQGQSGSALDRAANDEHKFIKLQEGDSVVFSADPIPSTEAAQSALIDSLTKLGVEVYYSAIMSDLHVSGHAAVEEIRLMVNLIKPKNMLGIGGTYRHMKAFSKMAQDMGYDKKQVLDVIDGDTILIGRDDQIKIGPRIDVKNVYVDGLGIGDVGQVMLRDRQQMSEEGIVIVVVPIDQHSGKLNGEPDVISRGFVFETDSQGLLDEARSYVKSILTEHDRKIADWRFIRKIIEEKLQVFLYKQTERRPLILPIVVEV